jgi:hypothetical protein
MSTLPDQLTLEEVKAQNTPAVPAIVTQLRAKPDWHRKVLDGSVVLAGPPALITLVASFFTDSPRAVAVCTGIGLLIAIGLMFFPRLMRKDSMLVVLPWLVTGVLVIVLVLVVFPSRARKQSRLLASSWLAYQKDLETAAALCKKKGDSRCLAEALGPIIERRPQPARGSDIPGLASDLLAGQLMLANDNIRSVLNSRLGVGDRFLGSGFSEPVQSTDLTAARVSEYFAPNLSDSAALVWLWKLDPGKVVDGKLIVDHQLKEILLNTPPENHADFANNWKDWIERDHLGPGDPHPALVRFALLDLSNVKYSGCLGRPDATRVFMNNLGEVDEKTIAEAATSSGYTVTGKADEPKVKLFVWVYAPTTHGIVYPATWKNVLMNFSDWVTADACNRTP